MAYTVRQFISECESFEYSQEYFDILKESMEIDLMERYIKNQEFLIESGIDTSVYTENYFMEADNKSVEDVKNKVNEKNNSIITKMKTRFAKLINSVIQFFKSFKNKLDPLTKYADNIRKKIENKKMTNEMIDNIYKLAEDFKSSEIATQIPNSFTHGANMLKCTYLGEIDQPYKSNIKFKYSDWKYDKHGDEYPETKHKNFFENFIAALCSTNYVLVDSEFLNNYNALFRSKDNPDFIGAVPADELIKILKDFSKDRPLSADALDIVDKLKTLYQKNKSGFRIDVNTKKLEDMVKALTEIHYWFDERWDQSNKGPNGDPRGLTRLEFIRINEAVTNSITITLRIYSDYLMLRKKMLGQIDALISGENEHGYTTSDILHPEEKNLGKRK